MLNISTILFKTSKRLLLNQFSTTSSIDEILNNPKIGNEITVKGWVKALRKQKKNIFVDINDGLTHRNLQIITQDDVRLSTGSSVKAVGILNLSPKGQLELHANAIEVYGKCDVAEGFPFSPKKEYTQDYARQFLHYRPRLKNFSSMLKVRSAANFAVHKYFESEGYHYVHTPILTSNDCEGAGEVFKCVPDNHDLLKSMKKDHVELEDGFFNKKTFLTVSGQLHLEAVAHALNKVYTFGPTFRAENSKTRFHLSEFYMLEAEIAFMENLKCLIGEVEKLIKTITKTVLDKCEEDIRICNGKNVVDFSWLNKNFHIISHEEAVEIVKKFNKNLNCNYGFSKEDEVFIVNHNGGVPTFVVHWPKEMKPFYMQECKHDPNKVEAFDLLIPNVGEMVGGSLREKDYDILKQNLLKTDSELNWYLELRKFGAVPTGGYGLGFERFLMMLSGFRNIRDVIPFPRWPHNCNL